MGEEKQHVNDEEKEEMQCKGGRRVSQENGAESWPEK